MAMTLTKLRANLFKVADRVIATGKPVAIERNGVVLKLVPETKVSKLSKLKPHPGTIKGDPEALVSIDWSAHWDEEKNL